MIQKEKLTYEQLIAKFQVKKPWDMIIIFVLNVLLAIPVFLIAHQNFIDLQWGLHLTPILQTQKWLYFLHSTNPPSAKDSDYHKLIQ